MSVIMSRAQRRATLEVIDNALAVAGGPPGPKRDGYREWLSTPSVGRDMIIDQAGLSMEQFNARLARHRALWHAAR